MPVTPTNKGGEETKMQSYLSFKKINQQLKITVNIKYPIIL